MTLILVEWFSVDLAVSFPQRGTEERLSGQTYLNADLLLTNLNIYCNNTSGYKLYTYYANMHVHIQPWLYTHRTL